MQETSLTKVDQVVIRFAGDSGDGMQLLGNQFTHTSAIAGNDLATLPDFPAEIRAPAGTREGVSGFQLQFSNHDIFTPGDTADVLVAMNPAALVTNIEQLKQGGLIVVNTNKFDDRDLEKARLDSNPLESGLLDNFRVIPAPIGAMTKDSVAVHGLGAKEADRCKNFFALGMMYWLYNRDDSMTRNWIDKKFKSPYREANIAAMQAGYNYANTIELFQTQYEVPAAKLAQGTYRNVTGNTTLATGLVAAAQKADLPLFYGSYPITPATDILHALAPFKNYGVMTFQAEDEIAAVCSTIGAAYGGAIAVTGTSGPGLALKGEAVGLAIMTELPMIIVNIQRGGPSTGLPTKTEQSDLLQAMYGRNGEAPMPILAPSTPTDCFDVAFEAVRIAIKYMVPVLILSDGYLGTGAEPWCIPSLDSLPDLDVEFATYKENFQPYKRDKATLARPWATPGTAGLEHRIGGLEKDELTGNVSYNPKNHQKMCELRAEKVARIAQEIGPTEIYGASSGTLVLGWGSTYGAIHSAVERCLNEGRDVAQAHLRFINPLPTDLGDVLARYDRIIVPEMNLGQLIRLLRDHYRLDAEPLNKVEGQPFNIQEIYDAIVSSN